MSTFNQAFLIWCFPHVCTTIPNLLKTKKKRHLEQSYLQSYHSFK